MPRQGPFSSSPSIPNTPNTSSANKPWKNYPSSAHEAETELLLRLREDEHLSWAEVAARFKEERGAELNINSARSRYSRLRNGSRSNPRRSALPKVDTSGADPNMSPTKGGGQSSSANVIASTRTSGTHRGFTISNWTPINRATSSAGRESELSLRWCPRG